MNVCFCLPQLTVSINVPVDFLEEPREIVDPVHAQVRGDQVDGFVFEVTQTTGRVKVEEDLGAIHLLLIGGQLALLEHFGRGVYSDELLDGVSGLRMILANFSIFRIILAPCDQINGLLLSVFNFVLLTM